MKIRIYVMTHKKFEMPQSPLFRPLHVGRACGENLGYPGDDTGENISDKNCYYSELTGLYWVWKTVTMWIMWAPVITGDICSGRMRGFLWRTITKSFYQSTI